jgi:hypothetical protein
MALLGGRLEEGYPTGDVFGNLPVSVGHEWGTEK